MSKKKTPPVTGKKKSSPIVISPPSLPIPLFQRDSFHALLIALMAFSLYANSLQNQFTLDDGMVLSDNKLVARGISGIPDILTHDSFYGSIGDTKNLSGGRYRPLSLVSYAIEVSFFGKNPFAHHLINVLLYALTCVVLLRFLSRFIFPQSKIASFVATMLFTFHPIHTEVVANIKSRDEIFSLLVLLLTFHFILLYLKESKKSSHLLLSLLCYSLALFSKENGLIFIVMIPITIFCFTTSDWKNSLTKSIWFWAVAAIYILIRFSLIGLRNNEVSEVMDNPYVLASTSQKMATILFVGLMYLKLLFYPYPLTYDYSFHQIPYKDFRDATVILSLLIYAFLGFIAFWRLGKKDVISWCIFFFFGSLFIVSNLLFNIGAPMAERFLYQASLPFIIAITELTRRIFSEQKQFAQVQRPVLISLLVVIAGLSSFEIFGRNEDWKTDETLFLHDVKTSSQSARANTYAGIALVRLCDASKDPDEKKEKATEAIDYFKKSLQIKSDYLPTLLNMGVAYSRIDSGDAAEKVWNLARSIEPDNSTLKGYDDYLNQFFFREGMKEGGTGNYEGAISNLEKAVKYNPSNADTWYNLGGAYFTIKNYARAEECWKKTLQLNPNYKQAQQGLQALPLKSN